MLDILMLLSLFLELLSEKINLNYLGCVSFLFQIKSERKNPQQHRIMYLTCGFPSGDTEVLDFTKSLGSFRVLMMPEVNFEQLSNLL